MWNVFWISIDGHVSDIEEPSGFEIAAVFFEDLLVELDGFQGTIAVAVDAFTGDGEDAGFGTVVENAVGPFAETKIGDRECFHDLGSEAVVVLPDQQAVEDRYGLSFFSQLQHALCFKECSQGLALWRDKGIVLDRIIEGHAAFGKE